MSQHPDLAIPQEVLGLQRALVDHPELARRCEGAADFGECIAEIAAYCNIILDGEYTDKEILHLCDILSSKLRTQSVLIIPAGFALAPPVETNYLASAVHSTFDTKTTLQ